MGAAGRGRAGARLPAPPSPGVTRGRADRFRESLRRSGMAYEAMFAETVHMRGHQNDQIDAYLARPLTGGRHPGVVVIPPKPCLVGPTKANSAPVAHPASVA